MKRFTETNKWRDQWFRRLSVGAKLLYLHMLDHCDASGVFELDLELASFDTGLDLTAQHFNELSSRIRKLASGKFWIEKFIAFQYGRLSKDCRPHISVMECMQKNGVILPLFSGSNSGSNFPASAGQTGETRPMYDKGIDTLSDRVSDTLKEPEKEKEKEPDKEPDRILGESENLFKAPPEGLKKFTVPTAPEVWVQAAKIDLPLDEAQAFLDFYTSNGWKVGRNPMKNWHAALANWKRTWSKRKGTNHGNKQRPDGTRRPPNQPPDYSKGF